MSKRDELIKKNIEINAERAAREHAKDNREDVRPEVRNFYRKTFENAEYERIRKENSKRGVK